MRDYILIAGPNGAGKSTLYNICPQFKALTCVNFDRFARNGLKDAARKAVTLIDSSFISGTSFIQETTLCGDVTLAQWKELQSLLVLPMKSTFMTILPP